MTLKVKGIKKQDERPLSNKTGYLVYLYKKLGNLEEEIHKIRTLMQETEPWYDSDTPKLIFPPLKHPD